MRATEVDREGSFDDATGVFVTRSRAEGEARCVMAGSESLRHDTDPDPVGQLASAFPNGFPPIQASRLARSPPRHEIAIRLWYII